MALRGGRGRGRRLMSFSVEAVGINKGETLPPSILQPTPLFPPMEQKPLPLTGGEEVEYMLALKQEFRAAMRSLPYFIQPAEEHRDVERYSDKYHSSEPADQNMDWTPDWKRLPKELRIRSKKRHRDAGGALVVVASGPGGTQPGQKVRGQKEVKEKEEVLLKLQMLEKKEEVSSEEEEGEEKKKQEGEEEGEEEYDEEEFEEETDYIMSYFDNEEDLAGDSDDNIDEAIY